MSAIRIIDDHKELENIGSLTHDQIDTTITTTPWVVLSSSLESQIQGARVLRSGTGISIVDSGPGGNVTISSLGTGAGGKIGAPEFGEQYLNGIFGDFNSEMPVGTPVDRFNQLLKFFAPTPAPNLSKLSASLDSMGVSAYLSFGPSNGIVTVSNVTSSHSMDVNDFYVGELFSDGVVRLGICKNTPVSGTINFGISSDHYGNGIINYVENVFGDADRGTLDLVVNNSIVHSINLNVFTGNGLPGNASGQSLNQNGSGFIQVSAIKNSTFVDGRIFPYFNHRSANFVVSTLDQHKGWNSAKVIHTIDSVTRTTNIVEWINFDNNQPLMITNSQLNIDSLDDEIYLSGVKYYRSGSLTYSALVSGFYNYVYGDKPITFTSSGISFLPIVPPTIDVSSGEDHNKILSITASSNLTSLSVLDDEVSVEINVDHPVKESITGGLAKLDKILLFNPLNISDNLNERFNDESYRLCDLSFDKQSDVMIGEWNSTIPLCSISGYQGLIVYDNKLMSPLSTVYSGDFRDNSEGGIWNFSPSGNPDYSGLSQNSVLSYLRIFRNESIQTYNDFSLKINGEGFITTSDDILTSNKLKVSIKIPGKTGWMDVAKAFDFDNTSDGDGTSFGTFLPNLGNQIVGTFGLGKIEPSDVVIVRILARADWEGYLTAIEFKFGASSGSNPSNPQSLTSISSTAVGVAAKLSFGSSKSIMGFSNPIGGNDVNSLYSVTGNYRGVFKGLTTITGALNSDTPASGFSYVANSFANGNVGRLKMFVNDAEILEIDLADPGVGSGEPGLGTGNYLNLNGSGFTQVSVWNCSKWSDGVTPDYSKTYRTANFVVGVLDQRPGWNYVRIVHVMNDSDSMSNVVEWINDSDSTTINVSDVNLTSFGHHDIYYQSGVKYYASSPTGSLTFKLKNVYRNVYSQDADALSISRGSYINLSSISMSGSGIESSLTLGSVSPMRQLLTSSLDTQNMDVYVTSSLAYEKLISLVGFGITSNTAAIGGITVTHPLKSTVVSSPITSTGFLIYSGSNTSTIQDNEYFIGETYRLVSGNYLTQTSVVDLQNRWDSSVSMNDPVNSGYYDGLLIFNDRLVSPVMGGVNGDFRSEINGGQISNSPDNNVDYSDLDLETRVYYRSFKNLTVNDAPQVTVKLYGDGLLVTKNSNLSSNKFNLEIKIPGKTGWLDVAKPSEGTGNIIDGDGGLFGNLSELIIPTGTTNICTFNGQTVNGTISTGGEYILMRITSHKNWTGYIDRIFVQYN